MSSKLIFCKLFVILRSRTDSSYGLMQDIHPESALCTSTRPWYHIVWYLVYMYKNNNNSDVHASMLSVHVVLLLPSHFGHVP